MCIRSQVSRKSALLGTLALCGALLLPSLPSVAESAAAGDTPPSVELISPRGVVLNPATNKVYAVDPAHKAVAIIDVAAHTSRSVKVGDDPLAIAVNSTSDRVYVLNTTSGTVSVLDGKTDTVVATVNVGKWPYVLAANPAENKVYVSNIFSNVITIIDGATNTTKTKPTKSRTILSGCRQGPTAWRMPEQIANALCGDGRSRRIHRND